MTDKLPIKIDIPGWEMSDDAECYMENGTICIKASYFSIDSNVSFTNELETVDIDATKINLES